MVKEYIRKSPATLGRSAIHLYLVSDPIPVPEATESNSDAAWALWQEALAQSGGPDTDFKSTVPAELPPFLFFDSPKRNL